MKLKIERLRDFERDPLNNFLTRSEMMEAVKELIALREALKGDQVPVGWIKSPPNEAVSWDSVDPIYLAGSTLPVGWRSDYKPVFTALQKPVVLAELRQLKEAVDFYLQVQKDNPPIEQGMHKDADEWLKRAAIEAAGGIVKDGD